MAAEWEGLEILLQDWVLNGRLNAQKAEVRYANLSNLDQEFPCKSVR